MNRKATTEAHRELLKIHNAYQHLRQRQTLVEAELERVGKLSPFWQQEVKDIVRATKQIDRCAERLYK